MAPFDPHSITDSTHPFTTHISFSFFSSFPTKTLHVSAIYFLSSAFSGDFFLDSSPALTVTSAVDPLTRIPIPFSLSPKHPLPPSQTLTLTLKSQQSFELTFTTSPASYALQWLAPAQTGSKNHPFVYTQCQSVHARSIFPCQDTPAARVKYRALLNIPSELSSVMSASKTNRRDPCANEARGACDDAMWCGPGRMVEEFMMEQPIPPYLFAFAVGELGVREVGPRTRVYVEGGVEVLDAAEREFKGTEEMIKVGESLFGKYEWDRFDLLVLPPSFPYGGMENPCMVFLTPFVIKGDGTGAQMVAHELAHSWTGNLITNKTYEHFWLNEGFTTYAERRIVEAVQGKEIAALKTGTGWRRLNDELERFKDNPEFTKLKTNQSGVNPDDVHSQVPYEKGFQFLWRIERQIGRPAFDDFLKKYIATFKFQSIDTDTFLQFLMVNVPGIDKHIDLKSWVEGTGIPPDAMEPESTLYTKIVTLASQFKSGYIPSEEEVADWHGLEWELYLKNLPRLVEPSQLAALDARYKLAESRNYEVKVAFLQLAVSSQCRQYYDEVERTLKRVGRMSYLRVLYTALAKSKDEEKMMAARIFSEAREGYHFIAQGVVESILSKYV